MKNLLAHIIVYGVFAVLCVFILIGVCTFLTLFGSIIIALLILGWALNVVMNGSNKKDKNAN